MKTTVLILRHMSHESAGTLERSLSNAGLEPNYVDLYEDVPARLPLERAAGLIVLGGSMSVEQVDRYPFLATDVRWIEQALALGRPVLGICLGAQLLAKTLGARVYPNRLKEIGWYPIQWTAAAAEDPLLAQTGTRTVFQWHGDTFELPNAATHLAGSAICENQAFRYGQRAYGFQFHIEMTAEMIDGWLSEPGNCRELTGLDYVDAEEIRRRSPQELPRLQALAADVFGRFAQMCKCWGDS